MNGTSPLLRKAMFGVVMVLAVLAGFGNRWRDQDGGTGTRIAFAAAQSICPTVRGYTPSASIADGARAIDDAALRRAADLILDRSKCRELESEHQGGEQKPRQ